MLVLTVRNGEAVFILVGKQGEKLEGEIKIKLQVCEMKNSKARLGFEAPEEVRILRKKVYDKSLEEKKK